jgi:hypothetical protein
MANTTKATPQTEEAREKGPETPDAPLPLLDLSDAAAQPPCRFDTKVESQVQHSEKPADYVNPENALA